MKGIEIKLPEESHEDYILRVSLSSAALVEKLFGKGKRREKQKDGWSPTMMSMIFALESAVTIRRHTRGYAKHWKWDAETFDTGMDRILRRLRARTLLLGEEADGLLAAPDGHASWLGLPLAEVDLRVDEVILSILRIKKRLHGRKRTELRIKINKWTAKREELLGRGLRNKIRVSLFKTLFCDN